MSKILKGSLVAQEINNKMKREIEALKKDGIIPKLGILQVGDRPDDSAYRRSIIKKCGALGIDSQIFEFNSDISMEDFTKDLEKVNKDNLIHGILIFRPLPEQLDVNRIRNLIQPDKDIDCMNPVNLENVFEGRIEGMVPCTPKAVVEILKYYDIPLIGANVTIINSSLVVGKPLSMMLLKEKATPTLCHSKTKNLKTITQHGDIVVSAIGKAKFFDPSYFNKDTVVIDVGINQDEDGNLCGDVNYHQVKEQVEAITPVPNGVGTVTTSILLSQVVLACKRLTKG